MNKKGLDKINLPDNLDNIIDDAISMAEEDKKKNRKGKGYKKVFKNIAAGIAIVTILGLGTTTLTYGIPEIKNAFEKIQNEMLNKGDYSKYATEVNQTVYDNGVGITLSEILCDGQNLYVTYIVESEEPFKYINYDYDPVKDYDLTKEQAEEIVNTQMLDESYSKVSFTQKKLDNSGIAGLEGKYINEHTFVGVEKYDLTTLNMEIPVKFDFEINYKRLIVSSWNSEREKDQEFKGSWNFKVPVKVDKSLTKEINVDDINKEGIGVSKVYETPFEIKILTNHPKDTEVLNYIVEVYDNNGDRLKLESQKWEDEYSIVTLFKDDKKINTIKVVFYDESLKAIDDENLEKHISYSKEINLRN
ncbi:DUF4179 domain-containing protein [Clostridium sp. LIBA-8841]|uniref:DUF4179 domain-containing protein n=1 Tax=Clostridium sp. LIBA-8841 TaxID=2987530 RepID=UPI002AC6B6B2|nr:DUF4179 domain-containing protein [Clostridium sp. LIBA-8841]MDZ5254297.1 DUF4179 domain-containing protein [Clostridium sp. LIBA-8841]